MPPPAGNPEALLGAADALEAAARRLREVGRSVSTGGRSTVAGWTGLAAPLALARLEQDATSVDTAAQACARAGPPLRLYAQELLRARNDQDEGERMAAEGRAAYDAVGSGATVEADAARERAVAIATDGANVVASAQERALAANEAAAREFDAATALLTGLTGPPPPSPVVGSDGTFGDGLLAAGGDVVEEVTTMATGVFDHVNVFGDRFGATWSDTWETTKAALADPLAAGAAMVRGTVAPLVDSYRSGGIDEALGRSPGVIASVVGGKGLTKLQKLDKLRGLDHTKLASDGGLLRHEEAGGHTLAPQKAHVGASDAELIDRLTRSRRSLAGTSSYYDRATAERRTSENVTGNRDAIADWLRSGSSRPKAFEWDHDGLSGRYAPAGSATTGSIKDVSRSRVVLVADDAMSAGYRILTSFPRP